MATGLLALLDDVAMIAKIAAASLDDVATQSFKGAAKAAGVVIDDAAVTPRYVIGFTPDRELPIIGKIALGSLRNKLFYLLPAALALSLLAPWAIPPLLMAGGLYLVYEGAEKVHEALFAGGHDEAHEDTSQFADAKALEDAKISGAIKTDFVLSAEIMAITLGAMPQSGFWFQASVLAVVGASITFGVYGVVALIVKADDFGLFLARPGHNALARGFGRGLVKIMPAALKILTVLGTAAMIWVGGEILAHGLEHFGAPQIYRLFETLAHAAAASAPMGAAFVGWLAKAASAGVFGLAIGFALIPLVDRVVSPAARAIAGRIGRLR